MIYWRKQGRSGSRPILMLQDDQQPRGSFYEILTESFGDVVDKGSFLHEQNKLASKTHIILL